MSAQRPQDAPHRPEPDGPGGGAVAHYQRRSEAVYRLLTEGYPDPEDGDVTPEEREVLENLHRTLGQAMESEAFADGEPGEVP